MKAAEERIEFSPEVMAKAGQGSGRNAGPSTPLRSAQDDNLERGGRNAGPSASLRSAQDDSSKRLTPQGWAGPIKHVVYIIKENRTYDQIFGDLEQNGKRVGNGDASLTMYGKDITPNQHAMALQFGVMDNF